MVTPRLSQGLCCRTNKRLIEVNEADIVIGDCWLHKHGLTTGSKLGTATTAISIRQAYRWRLVMWLKLSGKSHKFGDPQDFNAHVHSQDLRLLQSLFETRSSCKLYEKLTHVILVRALLSLADSNWSLSISVSSQPVMLQPTS